MNYYMHASRLAFLTALRHAPGHSLWNALLHSFSSPSSLEEVTMPTIPVISPKGGVGKTTTALVLALQLVARGAQVTLIDADPNQPVRDWAEGGNAPEGLTIVCKSRSGLDLHGVVWRDITADTIRELITEF